MNAPAALLVVDDPRAAELLFDAKRQLLLEALREPMSAAAAAERVGMPRQHANYHARQLEQAGLVRLLEERARGNARERILQSVAVSFVIGPRALGALAAHPKKVADRYSLEYIVALGERLIGELADLAVDARRAGQTVPSLSVETQVRFASVEARAAFARELTSALAGIIAKYHRDDHGGESYRLLLAVHPLPLARAD